MWGDISFDFAYCGGFGAVPVARMRTNCAQNFSVGAFPSIPLGDQAALNSPHSYTGGELALASAI